MLKVIRLFLRLMNSSTAWALHSAIGGNAFAKMKRAVGLGTILMAVLNDRRHASVRVKARR